MRITRPRVAAAAAIASLLLTTAACGSSASNAGSNDAKITNKVSGSITVWTWDGAPGADSMNALAAAFEKKTGVKVNSKVVNKDDYKTQAQLALNSGQAIDVLGVQPSEFATQVESKMRPVSDYQSELPDGLNGYSDVSLAQLKKIYNNGTEYSVPFGSSASAVCFYNADILKKAGAQPPKTWSDVKTLTADLKKTSPGTLTLVAPAGGTDAWFQDEFVLTMVGQKDPKFFDNVRYNNGAWDTDSYKAALAEYGKLFTDGTLQRSALDMGYADAMGAFTSGKAAMACSGSWEAGLLLKSYRQANGVKASSVGVIPVPSDDGQNRTARSFLDVTWGIPKSAKNPSAAAAFIAFATQQSDGINTWANNLGFIPDAKGWKVSPSVFSNDPTALDGYNTIESLVANPSSDRNNLSSFSAQVGKYVEEVAEGRMDASTAAEKGQKDLKSGLYN